MDHRNENRFFARVRGQILRGHGLPVRHDSDTKQKTDCARRISGMIRNDGLKGYFMRHKFALRFASGVAMVAVVAFGMAFAAHAENKVDPANAAAEVPFDPASVTTFSGAYLAANSAEVARDGDTAITLYKKALALEPENTSIKEKLMLALLINGKLDEGAVLAEELKEDQGVERITTVARGAYAISKGAYDKVEPALKYDGPNDLDRMMNGLLMAWAQYGAGDGKKALATINGLNGPEWFAIFKNYHGGLIAQASGDVEQARKMLSEAVTDRDGGATAQDTYTRAVLALASLELKAGNSKKALDTVATGLETAPGYAPFQAMQAMIEKGEGAPAITTARQGAAAVLFSVGAALNQTVTEANNGGGNDIVSFYLQTAHALDPESADTLILLGGIAEAAKQGDKAIAYYSQVPKTSPMRRISELQLGLVLADSGKTDEARKHLKSLIDADPKDIRSYLAYGSVLSVAKDFAAAAENYERAIKAMGSVPNRAQWPVFYQLGIAYERLKQWDKAEPNFKKALELNPDQPQVLNYLGYSWIDMNIHLDEGMNMIRKAVDLRPDDGYIVDSLGWAYYRLGKYSDAVEQLERAVELMESDATINDHLGDAYWRVGRKLEAGFQWKRALLAKPEEAEVKKIEAKIANGLPELSDAEKAKAAPVIKSEATVPKADVAQSQQAGAQTSEKSHTVVKGDSLWNIARDVLGDGMMFHSILGVNPELKKNPDLLQPGQSIILP
jgi:tetratricopeptide (TPR) repeat protein